MTETAAVAAEISVPEVDAIEAARVLCECVRINQHSRPADTDRPERRHHPSYQPRLVLSIVFSRDAKAPKTKMKRNEKKQSQRKTNRDQRSMADNEKRDRQLAALTEPMFDSPEYIIDDVVFVVVEPAKRITRKTRPRI